MTKPMAGLSLFGVWNPNALSPSLETHDALTRMLFLNCKWRLLQLELFTLIFEQFQRILRQLWWLLMEYPTVTDHYYFHSHGKTTLSDAHCWLLQPTIYDSDAQISPPWHWTSNMQRPKSLPLFRKMAIVPAIHVQQSWRPSFCSWSVEWWMEEVISSCYSTWRNLGLKRWRRTEDWKTRLRQLLMSSC